MIESVTFASAAGEEARGSLALPAGTAAAAAVVVIHEWWGVNDQVESTVERLAAEGFVVLAVDLYRGFVTRDPAEAERHMKALPRERAMADLRGAVDYLRAHPRGNGKVAITGFCMGGAYALAAACFVRGLAAVVPFYGLPPAPDWSLVDAPILAHVAARDTWVTPAAAERVQEALAARGQRMDLHVYDADHAFMNEQRPEVYSPDDARVAWERTVDFLRLHTA